ncbi:MAG: DNA primase [Myxococcales bacterium]
MQGDLSTSCGLTMLAEGKIDEIRGSVDLVALINEYVPLRRQGARFVGLCPFHQEKTPSFGVSRGKDFYYCFGCQATGDAFTFLRHVEGLSFVEAAQKLAERAGIELPKADDPGQAAMQRVRAQRERLAEVMLAAQTFFEAELSRHPHAEAARAQIQKRGIRPEIAERFHLGYAPSGWDGLAQHLTQLRIDLRDATDVGLIAPRRQGSGYYDRFRHRLMFPVADQHGRIIAFSGRMLEPPPGAPPDNAPPAKYINSPEGPLYKKGQVLFGLETARVAMRKHNQVILCEGNFDLLGIYQAGFEHVLAPLGTAFTLEQARLIRRFAEEVVVVFDGDGAGRKATRAAYDLLEGAGLRGKVVVLPPGHDPDTFLREHGVERFHAAVQHAVPMVDFLIDAAANQPQDVDAATRSQAIRSLGPVLAKLPPAELHLRLERVAQRFEIRDLNVIRHELRLGVLASRKATEGRSGEARRAPNSTAPQAPNQPVSAPVAPPRRITDLPERQCQVLGAMLDCPALFRKQEAHQLAELLTDSDLRAIFLVTARMVEERGDVDARSLLEHLAQNPARTWLAKRLSSTPELDAERAEQVWIKGLPLLDRDRRDEQRARLKREIQIALQSGDTQRAQELTRQRDELAKS